MSFVLRAFCYIKRKWKKTILLSGVFCVTAFTMSGTWEVLKVSGQIADQMRKESNSKITIEILKEENYLNDDDADLVKSLPNVGRINRVTETTIYANGFSFFSGADNTDKAVLHGFDDMLRDSPFEEKICRIVSGKEASNNGEIVINQRLAESNEIGLNDELSFICGEQMLTAKVVGLYLTGNENIQTEAVLTENRIENQIYTVNDVVFGSSNAEVYKKVIAYVDEPEKLTETENAIFEMVGDRASVRTLDTAYQKIKLSLSGTERVTKLVLILMTITGVFVTGSLLILWMRNRKTEIAVYISIGKSKTEIFMQMLLEILLIWSFSAALSCLFGKMLFPKLGAFIEVIQDMDITVSVSLLSHLSLWLEGVFVLMLLNTVSLLPYFTKNPKEILSEMED